ncbi:MAG: type II toxin-antitoxin system VapC family toxin [Armatimonadota bacterium]|nr:type II toxin-antitoxin system VapC family toxin [Armatimonadota bacterium]
MSYLIDTNVLLRRADLSHAQHQVAHEAVEWLLARGEELYITPQNLIEFRAVATRPIENRGLAWTPQQASAEVVRLETTFLLAPDTSDIYPEWRRLVHVHQVIGLPVHDARLAAVMAVYGISHLLTFNASHFRRYPHITVGEPQDVQPPAAEAPEV